MLHAVSSSVLESGMIKRAAWWANTCPIVFMKHIHEKTVRCVKRTIIFSNHNFSESIIEIRATLCDGDMVIDHPYAVFMSRSALLKKM